jgi:hypothetical protein
LSKDYRVPVPDAVKKHLNEKGAEIAEGLPKGWGFALLFFTYGEDGTMVYLSNADRNDMLKALAEFIMAQGN